MELGPSLPPGQLGSGETRLSGSGGSFSEGGLVKKDRVLWPYMKMDVFPPPFARSLRRFHLLPTPPPTLFPESLVGRLKVKLTAWWEPTCALLPSWSFNSHTCLH